MSLDANDPLTFYLRELGTIPPLTRDEESDLLKHVRSHDEVAESAAKCLIEAHLSLVVSIAERNLSSGVPLLDLVKKGNEALFLALQDFTSDSGDSFSAYAATYIEHAISKAIADDAEI